MRSKQWISYSRTVSLANSMKDQNNHWICQIECSQIAKKSEIQLKI